MTPQRIIVNVWCDRNAQQAGEFYADVLPDTTTRVAARYPTEGLPEFQSDFAGEPLAVDVDIAGHRIVLINAGDEFRPNPTVSFVMNFDSGRDVSARERLEEVWHRLGAGGTVLMPLGEYPFSPCFGWVQDRYGVSWQLDLRSGDPVQRPFVMPALMFCGPAQNRAAEAMELYTSLLPGSSIGTVLTYDEPLGPATAGSVMVAEFDIAGVGMLAMDSGAEHAFDFSPGMSLEIDCADQTEIDRVWAALSAVPEAEQCGWCVDRFGLSWQVVPDSIGELMAAPGAYAAMLEMKKIDIDRLRRA